MDPKTWSYKRKKIAPKSILEKKEKKELCPHGKMLGLLARKKTMGIENGAKKKHLK